MYLLDTNVVSADAPGKSPLGREVFGDWLRRHSDRLFLSSITIAEVEAGIVRAERTGASAKAKQLRKWLSAIEQLYGDRVLSFGVEEAHFAGMILDRARAHDPGFEDIAIAATAGVRGFTILTANERHFAPLGVPHVNPFRTLPTS